MRVNEIFYSLQGEGHFTGHAAVFVRLSGCNRSCTFCDTKHKDGREMSVEEIVSEACTFASRHIVLTGGEPTMQVTGELTEALHGAGFFVQMETNGSLPLKEGACVDWVTCSPKGGRLLIGHIDEVKMLYHGDGTSKQEELEAVLAQAQALGATEARLQPLDTGIDSENKAITQQTINYILNHPQWKLSLQTHKILNVR